MANKPKKEIRLNLTDAAREFGKDTRTMGKAFKDQDIQPGKDNKYTIRQIHGALMGGFTESRARKMRAEADIAELEAAEKSGELIKVDEAEALMNRAFTTCMQKIKGMGDISDDTKTELVDGLKNDLLAVKK